jgi:MoaA/NifB/PqqE/SkfB family radical SAM enzyme
MNTVTTEETKMIERFKMYRDLVNPDVAEKMAIDNLSIYGYAKWTVDTQLSPEQKETLNDIKAKRVNNTAI